LKFQQKKKFATVSFSEETVRGVLFRQNRDVLEPLVCISEKVSSGDPSAAWKSVLKAMGRGRDYPLYLTGSLRNGICFDTRNAALPPRLQRQALELELPRHLLNVPDHVLFQFATVNTSDDGMADLRVYAAPDNSFEPLAAMLTQSSSRADGFLYPALALKPDDPPFYAPELEKELFFANGNWRPLPAPEGLTSQWNETLCKEFALHSLENFDTATYLTNILAARLLKNDDLDADLDILPKQLRPNRLKAQLRITAALVLLLLLNIIWSSAGSWKGNYFKMRSLKKETTQLQQENAELKRKLKSKEKAQKELLRLLNLRAGEPELQGKFADLSSVIPQTVLVTSMRWTENGVELQMQSTENQTDISGALRALPYWKISQLQQRRWGNSDSTMITLKLVPAEVKK
jgi:Tfp pilus assembly protein PilN